MSVTDFSYTAPQGYRFDWMTTPGQCGTPAAVLNDPKHNTPRPCKHGNNCYWKGHTKRVASSNDVTASAVTSWVDDETGKGCGFVHPGEEGIARRLFPGRTTTHDDGRKTWEPPVVRLVGGATYYERRRLGLSWPEWKEQKERKAAAAHAAPAPPAPAAASMSAAAAPWYPPLPMAPPPSYHAHAPQAPMLSAWLPSPGYELAMAQAILAMNPALHATGAAMAKDMMADVQRELKNPSYHPQPSITSYSWDAVKGEVKKESL